MLDSKTGAVIHSSREEQRQMFAVIETIISETMTLALKLLSSALFQNGSNEY